MIIVLIIYVIILSDCNYVFIIYKLTVLGLETLQFVMFLLAKAAFISLKT